MAKMMRFRRIVGRVLCRIGRRGASLLFVGLVSLVVAASLATPPAETLANPGYLLLASFLPLDIWAIVWAIAGIVCLTQAFARSDRVAFSLATAIMCTWGAIYVFGAISGDNPRGWVLGGVWLGFGGWLTLISTWPEAVAPPAYLPPDRHRGE